MTLEQSIVVIDDDADIGEFITDVAALLGLKCLATTDPSVFLEVLTSQTDLIILDLLVPRVDGIELLRALGEQRCRAGIVLMSSIDSRVMDAAEQLAAELGLSIVGRLTKPFGADRLEAVLKGYRGPSDVVAIKNTKVVISDEDLRNAVAEENFVLHYQPQIDIKTKKVVGFEALVRWLHPRYGLVYPEKFIQQAVDLHLIEDLTWIVIRNSVACWHRFKDIDGDAPSLSVNIAAGSLCDLRLPDKLEGLLARFEMPQEKLILEVTECGVLDHLSNTLDVLTRLRLKGFQLSVDDFGIGYSTLQQLRRIPANELKIDKSFISQISKSHSDRVVVQKTLEIGHELGMRMVAEGVETQDQLDFLSQNGCDIAQGYLIYKPSPLAILLNWLHRYRSLGFTPVPEV